MKETSKELEVFFEEASKKLETPVNQLEFYSWPECFASTSGPHGGIGGSALTNFQVFGFRSKITEKGCKCCSGIWKSWDDGKTQW